MFPSPLGMSGMPSPSKASFAYERDLGWREFDEDGDSVPAVVAVVEGGLGYNVFRLGQHCFHLEWFDRREDAIDWAVDRSRQEVAEHELRQSERE